ncbi:MAG TPA: hypothetical protein VKO16_13730 [Polyangia bacterium]|nr:hypothetical protein [Polyangia bacterium]
MRSLQKGFVLVSAGPRRGTVAGLQRRLRARDEVPTSGQIVFRGASQTLR